MIQEFIYKVLPPEGLTVDSVVEALVPPAQNLMNNNRFVAGVKIDIEDEYLELNLALQGHDRWWNKRRVPYLIMSILTGAGLSEKDVEFQRIENTPNLKSARFWTGGQRNKGQRIFMPADGSDPPPRPVRKPSKRDDQHQFDERTGWHQKY